MPEDKLLVWRCKNGSKSAFKRIYTKYVGDLRNVAASLMFNTSDAEDIVHDVYVSFMQEIQKFELRRNLKGYLLTCVANKSRNYVQKQQRQQCITENEAEQISSDANEPLHLIVHDEEVQMLSYAMKEISYELREAVVLRLHGEMKFKTIAKLQKVSVKTAHSRYRDGLERVKLLLNGKIGT